MKVSNLKNYVPESSTERVEEELDIKSLNSVLLEINKKLVENNDLNDKIDLLVFKVEKVEENQEKILKQMDSLSDAVYDPDKGLFARIKDSENRSSDHINDLDKDILEIKTNNQIEKKTVDEIRVTSKENSTKISEIISKLDDIIKWKKNIGGIVKWTLGVVGSTGIGLLLKYGFEVLSK